MGNEIICIFVKDLATNTVRHHEFIESGRLSPKVLTGMLRKRQDELMAELDLNQFEVYWEGFDSLATFHSKYPALAQR